MLIKQQDVIEKLECFCMEKALEDQNHLSAEVGTQMSSADCISRQDVLDYIDTMPSELTSDGRRMVRRSRLTEYIGKLPSAEPEIIRCKDCKYRGKMVCPFGIKQMPRDNDFCFYGKRREDDKRRSNICNKIEM